MGVSRSGDGGELAHHEFGRHQTRLDWNRVYKVGAYYLGTIAVKTILTVPDQPNHHGTKQYRVLDVNDHGDNVTVTLMLTLVTP